MDEPRAGVVGDVIAVEQGDVEVIAEGGEWVGASGRSKFQNGNP
jgi:hypothetical protein